MDMCNSEIENSPNIYTMQNFCSTCIKRLPTTTSPIPPDNAQTQQAVLPQFSVQCDENLIEILNINTGLNFNVNNSQKCPRQICQDCYEKLIAFDEFRDAAICCATAMHELLSEEKFTQGTLHNLQYFCCTCLNKIPKAWLDSYTTTDHLKNSEVKRWMEECNELKMRTAIEQWPTCVCNSCCAKLKEFLEFEEKAKQTLKQLEELVILKGQEQEKNEPMEDSFIAEENEVHIETDKLKVGFDQHPSERLLEKPKANKSKRNKRKLSGKKEEKASQELLKKGKPVEEMDSIFPIDVKNNADKIREFESTVKDQLACEDNFTSANIDIEVGDAEDLPEEMVIRTIDSTLDLGFADSTQNQENKATIAADNIAIQNEQADLGLLAEAPNTDKARKKRNKNTKVNRKTTSTKTNLQQDQSVDSKNEPVPSIIDQTKQVESKDTQVETFADKIATKTSSLEENSVAANQEEPTSKNSKNSNVVEGPQTATNSTLDDGNIDLADAELLANSNLKQIFFLETKCSVALNDESTPNEFIKMDKLSENSVGVDTTPIEVESLRFKTDNVLVTENSVNAEKSIFNEPTSSDLLVQRRKSKSRKRKVKVPKHPDKITPDLMIFSLNPGNSSPTAELKELEITVEKLTAFKIDAEPEDAEISGNNIPNSTISSETIETTSYANMPLKKLIRSESDIAESPLDNGSTFIEDLDAGITEHFNINQPTSLAEPIAIIPKSSDISGETLTALDSEPTNSIETITIASNIYSLSNEELNSENAIDGTEFAENVTTHKILELETNPMPNYQTNSARVETPPTIGTHVEEAEHENKKYHSQILTNISESSNNNPSSKNCVSSNDLAGVYKPKKRKKKHQDDKKSIRKTTHEKYLTSLPTTNKSSSLSEIPVSIESTDVGESAEKKDIEDGEIVEEDMPVQTRPLDDVTTAANENELEKLQLNENSSTKDEYILVVNSDETISIEKRKPGESGINEDNSAKDFQLAEVAAEIDVETDYLHQANTAETTTEETNENPTTNNSEGVDDAAANCSHYIYDGHKTKNRECGDTKSNGNVQNSEPSSIKHISKASHKQMVDAIRTTTKERKRKSKDDKKSRKSTSDKSHKKVKNNKSGEATPAVETSFGATPNHHTCSLDTIAGKTKPDKIESTSPINSTQPMDYVDEENSKHGIPTKTDPVVDVKVTASNEEPFSHNVPMKSEIVADANSVNHYTLADDVQTTKDVAISVNYTNNPENSLETVSTEVNETSTSKESNKSNAFIESSSTCSATAVEDTDTNGKSDENAMTETVPLNLSSNLTTSTPKEENPDIDSKYGKEHHVTYSYSHQYPITKFKKPNANIASHSASQRHNYESNEISSNHSFTSSYPIRSGFQCLVCMQIFKRKIHLNQHRRFTPRCARII